MESDYIDLFKEKISIDKVLNFKIISAKRNVSNIDSDKTLSILSSNYYKKKKKKKMKRIKFKNLKMFLVKRMHI